MVSNNNIRERRSARFSEIITIPANDTKRIDFSKDKYAPYLNYILRNLSDNDLKYYINNAQSDEFDFLGSGEIIKDEAQVIRKIVFENSNAVDCKVVLTMNNKVTQFELDLLKVGEMKYE